MIHLTRRLIPLTAALGAAALLNACGSDSNPGAPAPSATTSTNFSTFAEQTFAQPANSQPVDLPSTFVFDVNGDPMAFAALLM